MAALIELQAAGGGRLDAVKDAVAGFVKTDCRQALSATSTTAR